MAIEMIEPFDQGTQIKVIGVGGGGGEEQSRHQDERKFSHLTPLPAY